MRQLPIRFELRWLPASNAMRECCAEFYSSIRDAEPTQRARPTEERQEHELSCNVLLCNLLVLQLYARSARRASAELEVRIGTRASQASPIFGRPFNSIIDAAVTLGLLTLDRDRRVPARNGAQRTVASVQPTEALGKYLPEALSIADLKLCHGKEPLIRLRTYKNKAGRFEPLPLPDLPVIEDMTDELCELNDWIASLPITADGSQLWRHRRAGNRTICLISTKQIRLHRVFRKGRYDVMQEGGRLYGGWWINMRKSDRREYVRIAGEPIAHIDFRQCHLRLAYAGFHQPWPFDDELGLSDTDPYIAARFGDRADWKTLTAMLLGARQRLSQYPGLFLERQAMEERFEGKPAKLVYDAIRQRHSAIASLAFERGVSGALERMESGLMMELLRHFRDAGIPALPVHDAVIAPRSKARQVAAIMEKLSLDYIGVRVPAGIE